MIDMGNESGVRRRNGELERDKVPEDVESRSKGRVFGMCVDYAFV